MHNILIRHITGPGDAPIHGHEPYLGHFFAFFSLFFGCASKNVPRIPFSSNLICSNEVRVSSIDA